MLTTKPPIGDEDKDAAARQRLRDWVLFNRSPEGRAIYQKQTAELTAAFEAWRAREK
jgi:hypothetical protein